MNINIDKLSKQFESYGKYLQSVEWTGEKLKIYFGNWLYIDLKKEQDNAPEPYNQYKIPKTTIDIENEIIIFLLEDELKQKLEAEEEELDKKETFRYLERKSVVLSKINKDTSLMIDNLKYDENGRIIIEKEKN